MYNRSFELKKSVIEYYLKNGSIRKTAKNFGIHYQTLYRWLKIYNKVKDKFFVPEYRPPWNRTDIRVEKEIIHLKEKNPSITIKGAQEILKRIGIQISCHTIWSVWNRYGYTGIIKKHSDKDYDGSNMWTKEAQKKFSLASNLFNEGKIEEAANILNNIPSLPQNELLTKIPDRFLTLSRRLEKYTALFGKIPISENLKRLDEIYNAAKEKGLLYLAIRAGLAEIALLSWKGDLSPQKRILNEIKTIFRKKTAKRRAGMIFDLYFTMLIAEANLCIDRFKIDNAYHIAQNCHRSLMRRTKPPTDLILHLARLYVRLGELTQAEYWYQKAVTQIPDDKKRDLNTQLALNIYFMKGEYAQAMKLLRNTNLPEWIRIALPLRFKSLYYLIKGDPNEAIDIATKSLDLSKEQELPRDIFNSYLTIAAALNAINEREKALDILHNLRRYIKKFKLTIQEKMLQIILGRNVKLTEDLNHPLLKIGFFLRKNRYHQALCLAKKKGLITILYRYIFFISEPVLKLLMKNKKLHLPKSILKLPIFNQTTITFYVRFVGQLIITRNQKPIKTKLKPKDAALLIHMSLKLNSPESFIYLDDLCRNFWLNQNAAHRNLSHSLIRIKKSLNIPGHYLEIDNNSGKPRLINRNLFFTTDYEEILRILSQAKAMERTGEWNFARKEYLKAFKLFRGEPFKKNFDEWSLNMRFEILTKLESEAINFAKNCIDYGNKNDARKILQKILKIIPDSEEAKGLLNGLMAG